MTKHFISSMDALCKFGDSHKVLEKIAKTVNQNT